MDAFSQSSLSHCRMYSKQCCGSMTFWCGSGSGSADPSLWLMDPDPDPAIFVVNLQDANKNKWKKKFFCLLLFEDTFTSFFKNKKLKRSKKNSWYQGFSYYFACWLKDPDPDPYPGDPKHIRIRRIRIRIRTRSTDIAKCYRNNYRCTKDCLSPGYVWLLSEVLNMTLIPTFRWRLGRMCTWLAGVLGGLITSDTLTFG